MVEYIKRLRSELESSMFCDVEAFVERGVEVYDTGRA